MQIDATPTDVTAAAVTVQLPFQEPLHADALLGFLAARTIPGVDEVCHRVYRRGVHLAHGPAMVAIELRSGYAQATLHLRDPADQCAAVARCRRLLDLDADPHAIDARLAQDPVLAPVVAAEPGVRVPGAVDGFEMAVRAIVGQQISVAGARTTLARLVRIARGTTGTEPTATGGGTADEVAPRGFPTPAQVAAAPDEAFGMPTARRRTLRVLAEAVADGQIQLDPTADRDETFTALLAITGIGPWTAQYVAMRALGHPDILLATDLGVRRGAAAMGLTDDPVRLAAHATENWAPWRSYATIRLWRQA